jgi:uncharacterized membrane-anchored protein YitT (DUF2179 family)
MGKHLKKEKIRRLLADGVSFVVGSVAFGAAVSLFIAPNDIAPGGVTGLAVLLQYLFHTPAGLVTFLINVPLLFFAFRRLSRRFFVRTLIGLILSSVMIDLFSVVSPFTGDRLLAAVFGGVLTGMGVGLIYKAGGSTGGAEIVAILLRRKFPFFSAGNMLMAVDGGVILLSTLVYRDWSSVLYAAVTVFLSAQVMDRLIYGDRLAETVFIITKKGDAITAAVCGDLGRGLTRVDAKGGFSGKECELLLCAVGRGEKYRLQEMIRKTDPEAFVIFGTAEEVMGLGFVHGEP